MIISWKESHIEKVDSKIFSRFRKLQIYLCYVRKKSRGISPPKLTYCLISKLNASFCGEKYYLMFFLFVSYFRLFLFISLSNNLSILLKQTCDSCDMLLFPNFFIMPKGGVYSLLMWRRVQQLQKI